VIWRKRRSDLSAPGASLGACVVVGLAACSSPDTRVHGCVETNAEALVNAASYESYLGIDRDQVRAIVAIVDATDPQGSLCSGTLVSEEWVITARHCLGIEPAEVWVTVRPDSTEKRSVVETVGHPLLDVGLARIAKRHDSDSGPIPIDTAASGDVALTQESVVEIAGYGITEAGDLRELRFLAERVVMADSSMITVGGFGLSGACNGDSGGPLLVRAPDGRLVVAGVLTSGSASCRDEDTYVRLDGLASWIEETIGVRTNEYRGCGTITSEGRCLYGSALFCEGSELSAQTCAGGSQCGWDVDARGYRCVEPTRDACRGVDGVGACRGEEATRCANGILERTICACGESCGIDGATGAPRCTLESTSTSGATG